MRSDEGHLGIPSGSTGTLYIERSLCQQIGVGGYRESEQSPTSFACS